MPGYIYLATNPVMPGLTKIGFSESVLSERFAALQSTGVPVPFELFAAFRVEDLRSCEKALHGAFAGNSDRLRMCSDCRVVDMIDNKRETTITDLKRNGKPT